MTDGGGDSPPVPRIPGKESLRPELPKRFYKEATAAPLGSSYGVFLDGRVMKTPMKRAFAVPGAPLAEAIAAEWAAQGERIDPASMWLTRLANTTIDAVADQRHAVAADIVKYALSDLVCYRAEAPRGLIALQAARWDPVLAWSETVLGARFRTSQGIVHVTQDRASEAAISAAVAPLDHWRLTPLHVLTTLSGSALLALAVARGGLSAEDAWSAAHVDEDWQISQWGDDIEASARRAQRHAEWQAAVRFLALV